MTIKHLGGIFGRNPEFNDVTVEDNLAVGIDSAQEAIHVKKDDPRILVQDSTTGFALTDSAIEFTCTDGSGNARSDVRWSVGNVAAELNFRYGNSLTSYATLNNTGNLTLSSGNLTFGASGKGIDFSATSGTGTSELFDDYEEGYHIVTATPETSGTLTLDTAFDRDTFQYTKIGHRVFVSGCLQFLSVASPVGTLFSVSLPFAVKNVGGLSDRSAGTAYQSNTGTTAAVTLLNGNSVALVRIDASTIVSGSAGQIFINFDYVT